MTALHRLAYLAAGVLLGVAGLAGLLAAAARGYADTETGGWSARDVARRTT